MKEMLTKTITVRVSAEVKAEFDRYANVLTPRASTTVRLKRYDLEHQADTQ